MKKNHLLNLVFIFISIAANAQPKIFISGEQTNRKLTWEDFKGKVDKSNPYFANTMYNISYKTSDVKINGDSISIGKFDLTLELDPKNTWAKKGNLSDELLLHEQGHFDVGILCVNEIWSLYKQAKFTRSNYNTVMQSIVGNTSRKYHEMGLRYDQETNHSKNKEQQAKWNAFFKENLAK